MILLLPAEDEGNRQKTKYDGSNPTVQYDPAEAYNAYKLPNTIVTMILLLK